MPESVKDNAMEIIELNLTNLSENCLVAMNNVQSGALPYISVYTNAGQPDSVRRLVFPELKYAGTADAGIRVTLLYAPELTDSAEMHAPFEEPENEEPALPHTDGHASHLTIVCEPATAEQTTAAEP